MMDGSSLTWNPRSASASAHYSPSFLSLPGTLWYTCMHCDGSRTHTSSTILLQAVHMEAGRSRVLAVQLHEQEDAFFILLHTPLSLIAPWRQ